MSESERPDLELFAKMRDQVLAQPAIADYLEAS